MSGNWIHLTHAATFSPDCCSDLLLINRSYTIDRKMHFIQSTYWPPVIECPAECLLVSSDIAQCPLHPPQVLSISGRQTHLLWCPSYILSLSTLFQQDSSPFSERQHYSRVFTRSSRRQEERALVEAGHKLRLSLVATLTCRHEKQPEKRHCLVWEVANCQNNLNMILAAVSGHVINYRDLHLRTFC